MIHDKRAAPTAGALVARRPVGADHDEYLHLTTGGGVIWVDDPVIATSFETMRDATRAAVRLPSGLRAFSLPRQPEVDLRTVH